jgi:hypothetical protein
MTKTRTMRGMARFRHFAGMTIVMLLVAAPVLADSD